MDQNKEEYLSNYWLNHFHQLEGIFRAGEAYIDLVQRSSNKTFEIVVSEFPFSKKTPEEKCKAYIGKLVLTKVKQMRAPE